MQRRADQRAGQRREHHRQRGAADAGDVVQADRRAEQDDAGLQREAARAPERLAQRAGRERHAEDERDDRRPEQRHRVADGKRDAGYGRGRRERAELQSRERWSGHSHRRSRSSNAIIGRFGQMNNANSAGFNQLCL